MLVRVTVEFRRGAESLSPGALLETDENEAAALLRDGRAVPAGREERLKTMKESR